jgi:tRNA(fMet)-specific endonuclease VapC
LPAFALLDTGVLIRAERRGKEG